MANDFDLPDDVWNRCVTQAHDMIDDLPDAWSEAVVVALTLCMSVLFAGNLTDEQRRAAIDLFYKTQVDFDGQVH